MYWNRGQVIGGETGDGFYDPDGSLGQDYVWKTEAERARLASMRYPQQVPVAGLGAIYAGVYSDEVLGAQQAINALANALNYKTLGEDGKLGPATCGAIEFFFYQAPQSLLSLATAEFNAAAAYLNQHQNVGQVCSTAVGRPWAPPAALGPPPQPTPQAPPPAPEYTPEQIAFLCQAKMQQDGLAAACAIPECAATNTQCQAVTPQAPAAYTPEQLAKLCFAKIAQDGTLAACDVPECYGLNPAGCDAAYAAAPGCLQLIAERGVVGACAVPECRNLNPVACTAAEAQEPTYTFEEPELLTTTVSCQFAYGDSHPQIGLLQEQLNVALNFAGYDPIPVTGSYDAQTCGAIFELKGTFKPSPSELCPRGWDVPFECGATTPPTKRGEKRKMSTMAKLGIAGALLAVVGGGLYAAKAKAGGM